MFSLFLAVAASSAPLGPPAALDADAATTRLSFTVPVRIEAAGEVIRTENPGYAAPALHDVDGDGHVDMVVGQFNDGKLKVYPGSADGSWGEGYWLKAGGEIAVVPGVW
ncbi:hypothetical protein Pla163_23880 [Planctomycetes bacterium Pla163]|uniref:FG-GAP repeat protein n=1 Tax=Rohdeia mirabilis TaxID=2528008 RepID=A0A518D1C4_9BACT|nr:hypothetical protein Pla163_23880 [Planctomycetes bacterium Pla163]